MTDRRSQAYEASRVAELREPGEPRLYLSSAQSGWEGLVARAFHEPREMEGWRVSPYGDIMLMLYAGGALRIERRWDHGPWQGENIYPGELILNWGDGPSYETRWRSLSTLPIQTLDVHLSRDLVNHVAEEAVGVDLASLELVRRTGIRDPLLAQIALALWQELEQRVPAGKLYAQTAAQMLAVHLVRHYTVSPEKVKGTPPAPGGLTDRQIKRVLEFIQTHLSEDLSLEVLAQQVGFSPYHFARLFRRAAGTTPHQYVLRQRIERAQWLLQETKLPLAQVAGACGFAHQSHLILVFKRQLGCTPRAFRQDDPQCDAF
jgi:AraC family transcriptional regulator